MERDNPGSSGGAGPDETRRRLTSEVAEVESAMDLVESAAANRITLSGLKFGEELARRFHRTATARGLRLEPIPWPEDAGCDLIVRRIDD